MKRLLARAAKVYLALSALGGMGLTIHLLIFRPEKVGELMRPDKHGPAIPTPLAIPTIFFGSSMAAALTPFALIYCVVSRGLRQPTQLEGLKEYVLEQARLSFSMKVGDRIKFVGGTGEYHLVARATIRELSPNGLVKVRLDEIHEQGNRSLYRVGRTILAQRHEIRTLERSLSTTPSGND
ncbi:MAG: hypothetical protein Q8P13_02575 [bacterium]|nr:hypothetical protein [bacterium]